MDAGKPGVRSGARGAEGCKWEETWAGLEWVCDT